MRRVLRSDIPCSTKRECPDGQSCSAMASACSRADWAQTPGPPMRGSPDAPPGTIDTDKDGIPDNLDNCPNLANTDQANEDGDKFGDACDACPHISDTGATDSDGDGIRDACDPNPAAADRVWLFDNFVAGLPAWSRSDHWTAAGGNVVATAAGDPATDSEYLVTQFTSASSPDNFSVTMSVLVQAMMGSNGRPFGRHRDLGQHGQEGCRLRARPGPGRLQQHPVPGG